MDYCILIYSKKTRKANTIYEKTSCKNSEIDPDPVAGSGAGAVPADGSLRRANPLHRLLHPTAQGRAGKLPAVPQQ